MLVPVTTAWKIVIHLARASGQESIASHPLDKARCSEHR
jgi:hypothetical protein